MIRHYFIVGTDTEIGKTYCTLSLLHYFQNQGLKVNALKPVAAGNMPKMSEKMNEDAFAFFKANSSPIPYPAVNPFLFKNPCSPHIAAKQENKTTSVKSVISALHTGINTPADLCFIEGAGGWHTPLNEKEAMSDLAIQLGYPVILVVGMKLGCLNHAILTEQAILQSGLLLKGWIANSPSPDMPFLPENIETLEAKLKSPRISTLTYCKPLESLTLNL